MQVQWRGALSIPTCHHSYIDVQLSEWRYLSCFEKCHHSDTIRPTNPTSILCRSSDTYSLFKRPTTPTQAWRLAEMHCPCLRLSLGLGIGIGLVN